MRFSSIWLGMMYSQHPKVLDMAASNPSCNCFFANIYIICLKKFVRRTVIIIFGMKLP